MRAWVSLIFPDGSDRLGTDCNWVTPEYGSLQNMERYFIYPKLQRLVKTNEKYGLKVSVHNNWDTRYGDPDHVYIYKFSNPEKLVVDFFSFDCFVERSDL